MKSIITAFAGMACFAGVSIAAGPAMAANELVILGEKTPFNELEITVEGNGNRLRIFQEGGTAGAANSLDINLFGGNNGGPLDAAFSGAALELGLMPGTIEQSGLANAITLAVAGSGNLFAFSQHGEGNTISGAMTGQANQAVVLQEGANNHSGFSQSGIGNIVSIVQRSW